MVDIAACEKKLRQGLEAIPLNLDDKKILHLLNYLSEFNKWNKAYNLSAIRDPLAMVERHLLDSLVLVPFLKGAIKKKQSMSQVSLRMIDVGTGGGLPGIPLAITCPEADVVLLDSNGKKTRFLFQVKLSLNLGNVAIENSRVEHYQPKALFDIVVSRAFASLKDMVEGTTHLLTEQGCFWAMKGLYPENELRDCEKHAIVNTFSQLVVPGGEGERHLLELTPIRPATRIHCE